MGGNKEYLSTIEFCKFLNISRNTLKKWIKIGLPIIQPEGKGKFLRIEKTKALKWLEENSYRN